MENELILKFPQNPKKPILYVVYNQEMIAEAAYLISEVWGLDYLEKNVTITSIDTETSRKTNYYDVYLDPTMQICKHSWNI